MSGSSCLRAAVLRPAGFVKAISTRLPKVSEQVTFDNIVDRLDNLAGRSTAFLGPGEPVGVKNRREGGRCFCVR